jgi:hypothetical protein
MVARLCLDILATRPVGCWQSGDGKGGKEAMGEGEKAGEESSVMTLELKG